MSMLLVLIVVVLVAALAYAYVKHMSEEHDTFSKEGIVGPEPHPLLGNLNLWFKLGVFDVQTELYSKYKEHKCYGWFDTCTPVLILRDLDMIKDMMSKKFNNFVDRRDLFLHDPPMDQGLLVLKGDHWKHVRNMVSPMFSTGRVRKMATHVERNAQKLVENLTEKQENGEEIELKEIMSSYTYDAIASSGFGIEINSLKDPSSEFVHQAKRVMGISFLLTFVAFFSKPLAFFMKSCGMRVYPRGCLEFYCRLVDSAKSLRQHEKREGRAQDFLDSIIEAENAATTVDSSREEEQEAMKTSVNRKGLSQAEIYAQAITFIFAGYATTSDALSFTLFMLATHPQYCSRVQEELDRELHGEFPNYDNVQRLAYLDMCLNEAMRLYPSGVLLHRECTEGTDLQGVRVPKGRPVVVPVFAIHRDPDIWPEPEEFDPERFTPEQKAARHPYSYLAFGLGPRGCVGMRLAQVMVKVALVALLQKLTPTSCDKTVFPVRLDKNALKAKDGLWVKLEARK